MMNNELNRQLVVRMVRAISCTVIAEAVMSLDLDLNGENLATSLASIF